MKKDKNFRNMLASPSFNDEERSNVIGYLCEKLSLSEEVKNF